jgi:hypothetical protein
MIVTAALIWFQERPEDLVRCVRGMATVADRLVAVDGAYARYPGAAIGSPLDQVHAIAETAQEVGIEVVNVEPPDRLWAGQVEKRSFALRHASEGSDWVAVVDADWIISGNRKKARAELSELIEWDAADVVSVPFYTPPGNGQVASGWHNRVRDSQVWMPHIFRALPDMTVERYHWHVGARKGKDLVWLWGPPNEGRRVLPQHQLEAPYLIEHLTLSRTEEQVLASRAFLNDRVKVVALTDQEDDLPELPRPVFDYTTIPLTDLAAERKAARRARQLRKRRLRLA